MNFFGLEKGRKIVEDSIWTPTSKEELKQRFCSPICNDEILVVDVAFHPVWYFHTYFYASGWEYYEVGRGVSIFADNVKMEIFRENAKNTGDYHYEDISFGTEAEIISLIEALPQTLYIVSCRVFEEFINKDQKMTWQHNGKALHAGDKVYVSRYIRDDGAEYRDVDGHMGTIIYHFQSNHPFIKLDEEIKDCRIFWDGVHTITECGAFIEFPLTTKCQLKWEEKTR